VVFLAGLLLFADPLDVQLKRFIDVFAVVEENAAEKPPLPKPLYEGAIPGMLRRLDPHSVFFDPGQFEQLKELEKSTRKGFGTVVSLVPGRVIILQVLPNTPAAKSGLSPGDEILGINGFALNRLEIEQLVQLLTEARTQRIGIDVRRPTSPRLLQFVLTPEDVEAPSVDRAYMLKPDIGYVRATSFDAKTGKEIHAAIERLGGAALKGLVLDLRNNPGGLVPPALETSSLFLKPKELILSVRGRSVQGDEVRVPDGATPYSFPLAILVNNKTGSAAEIVAGAMQDHDRATIIGEPTFGKGLVQSVYPLSNGTGLALTTAFYYTPSGRSIQKPIKGQLDETTASTRTDEKEYRTDSGRAVKGGGGIQPDEVVLPEGMTRLRAVLEGTGAFATFATDFLARNRNVTAAFEVSNAVLDDFQVFLSARSIRPTITEWSVERDWIRNRVHQEILNQAVGVEKGDEVEARRDPQVKAALRAIGAL
jgi:carboxyl-terminal processing protease